MSYELEIKVSKIGEGYTFGWVVQEFFDSLSTKKWNSSTKNSYIRYYNMLIVRLEDRPLEEYTQEHFDSAILDIQREKTEVLKQLPYSEATLQKFRYLIRIVVRKAAEEGILSADILWGSCYSIPPAGDADEENKAEELVVLRKSLTHEEELLIAEEIFQDPKQSGDMMGLLLMFLHGLRNGEACGLTYGAIREMRMYPGNYYLLIYQTTVGETSELKAGGKTKNAPRKIPLLDEVYALLQKREEWIEERVKRGEIVLQGDQRSVKDLPIACSDKDASIHCTSRELMLAGKALLKKIALEEAQLAVIDRDLQDEKKQMEMMGVREKDATAYLFRRNIATHLDVLGLEQSEIEAYMAHDILNPEVDRSDFENEDLLYSIKQKLEQYPMLHKTHVPIVQIDESDPAYEFDVTHEFRADITLQPGRTVSTYFEAAEPNQALSGGFKAVDENYNAVLLEILQNNLYNLKGNPRKKVNVLEYCNRNFQKAVKRLQKMRKQQ